MDESQSRCLTDLFQDPWNGVLIPIVQRDYAQGRPDTAEVRERFLGALFDALERAGTGGHPLDLDFVYGYAAESTHRFVPIDGQQRLTTLFLLHWYLATRDGELEDFQSWALSGRHARFEYAVRTSSDDFLSGLSGATIDLDDLLTGGDGRGALSKTVRDQHWYFRSWERDPTVRSCLTMLDAIHAAFAHTDGLYRRLLKPRPAITFQFLDLDEFGLGDDLYIKMNARGRPLTDFEVLKSEVEKFARNASSLPPMQRGEHSLPMHEHLGLQLDTTWSHLLWGLLREEHHTESTSGDGWARKLDPQLLNLMRTLAIVTYPKVDATGDEATEVEGWLEDLHSGLISTFPGFSKRGAITESWVCTLVKVMDLWSGETAEAGAPAVQTFLSRTAYYDEAEMFRKIREDLPRGSEDGRKPDGAVTYTDLVRFAAYCLFLASDHDRRQLDDWMRLMSNLARNSQLADGDTLRRALRGIQRLLAGLEGGVLDYLAGGGKVDGFSGQQIREERLKAQLVQKDDAWRPLIERAELHGYFLGQIEFMLDFSGILEAWLSKGDVSWDPEQDASFRGAFELTLRRAEAIFAHTAGGLALLPDYLWERALLCHGDYFLRATAGSARRGLGLDTPDAHASWKALLRGDLQKKRRVEKRELVRALFAQVDPDDLEGSLRAVVNAGITDEEPYDADWRSALVNHPEMLAYCRRRWLLWDWSKDADEDWQYQVFLLVGSKRGTFQEVYTWQSAEALTRLLEAGRLQPFQRVLLEHGTGATIPPRIELYLPHKKKPSYRIIHDSYRFAVFQVSRGKETLLFNCRRDKLSKRIRKLARKLQNELDSRETKP